MSMDVVAETTSFYDLALHLKDVDIIDHHNSSLSGIFTPLHFFVYILFLIIFCNIHEVIGSVGPRRVICVTSGGTIAPLK